jgi:hypothetical protein
VIDEGDLHKLVWVRYEEHVQKLEMLKVSASFGLFALVLAYSSWIYRTRPE